MARVTYARQPLAGESNSALRPSVALSAIGSAETLLEFDLSFDVERIPPGDGGIAVAAPLRVTAARSGKSELVACAVSVDGRVSTAARAGAGSEAGDPVTWFSSPDARSLFLGFRAASGDITATVLEVAEDGTSALLTVAFVEGVWAQANVDGPTLARRRLLGGTMLGASGDYALVTLANDGEVPVLELFLAERKKSLLAFPLPVVLSRDFSDPVQVGSALAGDSIYVVSAFPSAAEGAGVIASVRLLEGVTPVATLFRGDAAMLALSLAGPESSPTTGAPLRLRSSRPNQYDFMGGFGSAFDLMPRPDGSCIAVTSAPDVLSGARLFTLDLTSSRVVGSVPLSPILRSRVGMVLVVDELHERLLLSSSLVLVRREEQARYNDLVVIDLPVSKK